MIEAHGLNKFYGTRHVVKDLTLTVPAGTITGFVGPNGAGKSTTMRILAGLESAQSGSALIDGRPMTHHPHPLTALGCLLNTDWFLPSRSGRDHLRVLAAPQGIPVARIDYLLETVGLRRVQAMPVKTYSLGMRQRLGIAGAFLADARNYILDEPANGLDPQGIAWLRHLLRAEADAGKSILLSSHLMSEMTQLADRVAVITNGVLVDEASLADFVKTDATTVCVGSVDPRLSGVIQALPGATITGHEGVNLLVTGVSAAAIGQGAARAGIVLHTLNERVATLEDAYLARTSAYAYPGQPGRSPLTQAAPAATLPPAPAPTAPPAPAVAPPAPTPATPSGPVRRTYPSRKERR